MKMSVIYYSRTGNTKKMAEIIAEAMSSVEGVEAKAFLITDTDKTYIQESSCIVIGTPIYVASVSAEIKSWLDKDAKECGIFGKLGGAFATVDYIHGGGDLGIRTILDHMMCYGMLTYSGGAIFGKPVIHLGPVALSYDLEGSRETFEIYGKRMAQKALEIFS